MQKLPVYLYTNLFDVILDLDNNTGIHQIMYQRPLKIQKGVRNTIQLQFKNSEQRKVGISDQSFVMNIFDEIDRTLVLTKNVIILDDASTSTNVLKGIAEVVLDPQDTINIDSKSYKFSITKLENDGYYSPAYSNTFYDVAGVLELKDEVYPALRPSISIDHFQRNYNSTLLQWEFNSGNIRPDAPSATALQTVAYYMTRFKGQVILAGTLENNPTFYSNYALIEARTYNGTTAIDYVNFYGNFTSIRITYIPEKNPADQTNNNTAYSGTFDKFLYRC